MHSIATQIAIVSLALGMSFPEQSQPQDYSTGKVAQIMCFLTGERISGMNKICFYDCAGSQAAITIKSYELCPLSITA